jgi:hypothetical protein
MGHIPMPQSAAVLPLEALMSVARRSATDSNISRCVKVGAVVRTYHLQRSGAVPCQVAICSVWRGLSAPSTKCLP